MALPSPNIKQKKQGKLAWQKGDRLLFAINWDPHSLHRGGESRGSRGTLPKVGSVRAKARCWGKHWGQALQTNRRVNSACLLRPSNGRSVELEILY